MPPCRGFGDRLGCVEAGPCTCPVMRMDYSLQGPFQDCFRFARTAWERWDRFALWERHVAMPGGGTEFGKQQLKARREWYTEVELRWVQEIVVHISGTLGGHFNFMVRLCCRGIPLLGACCPSTRGTEVVVGGAPSSLRTVPQQPLTGRLVHNCQCGGSVI